MIDVQLPVMGGQDISVIVQAMFVISRAAYLETTVRARFNGIKLEMPTWGNPYDILNGYFRQLTESDNE